MPLYVCCWWSPLGVYRCMVTYKLRLPQSPFIGEIVLYLGAAYVLILLVRIFYNQTKPIKKVKWRTRTNICNVWYSK